MNVKMEKILVMQMHCVLTPREVTCVAASEVLRVMAQHAQVSKFKNCFQRSLF